MTDLEIAFAKLQWHLLRVEIRRRIEKGTPSRVPWGKR